MLEENTCKKISIQHFVHKRCSKYFARCTLSGLFIRFYIHFCSKVYFGLFYCKFCLASLYFNVIVFIMCLFITSNDYFAIISWVHSFY